MWLVLLLVPAFTLPALLAQGQTSLWVPGTDEQPISADVLGVGDDGRTTWQLRQGTPTGEFTDSDNFPETATLVEGPSDAVLSAAFTMDGTPRSWVVSCTNNGGVAGCVRVMAQGGTALTVAKTETVSSFVVQVGGSSSAPESSRTASTAAPSILTTVSTGGITALESSPTTSGVQATGSSGASNASSRYQIAHSIFVLGIVGSVVYSVL